MILYFFYGSGMYRKHPNHTYGRNRNDSANNWARVMLEKQFLYERAYVTSCQLGSRWFGYKQIAQAQLSLQLYTWFAYWEEACNTLVSSFPHVFSCILQRQIHQEMRSDMILSTHSASIFWILEPSRKGMICGVLINIF